MCAVVDVPAGEARRFPVDGREVAVINLGDDGFRALDAVCSHEHSFLDEGEVDPDEGTIECPKHGSLFDVNSGKPLGLPAIKPRIPPPASGRSSVVPAIRPTSLLRRWPLRPPSRTHGQSATTTMRVPWRASAQPSP